MYKYSLEINYKDKTWTIETLAASDAVTAFCESKCYLLHMEYSKVLTIADAYLIRQHVRTGKVYRGRRVYAAD